MTTKKPFNIIFFDKEQKVLAATKYNVKGRNIKQWSNTIFEFLGTFVKKNSNSCHMFREEVSNSHFILFSMCMCFLNYSLKGKNQVTT
jgi:hypothetical protein